MTIIALRTLATITGGQAPAPAKNLEKPNPLGSLAHQGGSTCMCVRCGDARGQAR